MATTEIYNDLILYITPEKFYIQPRIGSHILVIDRLSEAISVETSNKLPAKADKKEFCGLLGVVHLLAGCYLVIAMQRELVGYMAGHPIWRLVKSELVPYHRSLLHLKPEQIQDNNTYLSMVEFVLSTPYFYFSYTYDLTHSIQRLHGISPDFWKQSLWERGDQRFVWNGHLLQPFKHVAPATRKFCLPLMHGFVSINQCSVNGHNFIWSIVSRRSILRAGTRWFRRGVDREGNVANFIETEQIIEYQGDKASFVQIRGSIPLFWHQTPDLRYKPPIQLCDIDPSEQYAACLRHLEETATLYGKQVLVDLVDHKGAEGRLENAFSLAVATLSYPGVKYEPFDFHHECRKMRWDRLSILIDRMAFDQDEMGYFLMLRDGTLSSMQEGVFRTNCIDCLDRTNVVQSMLAHRNLEMVLKQLGVMGPQDRLERHGSFERLFKNIWADHADVVSIQYSGTGALKTDFTRTGKRSKAGMIRDGINSLQRYYKNNLTDGFRQDAIDLFLGNGRPITPFTLDRGWRYFTFPSVLVFAVAMFFASVICPQEYSTESLLYLLFWGTMVVAVGYNIFRHGREFVDKPRLTERER